MGPLKDMDSRYISTDFSKPATNTDSIPMTICIIGITQHSLKSNEDLVLFPYSSTRDKKEGTMANAHTCSNSTKCSISLESVSDDRYEKRKKKDKTAMKRFNFLKKTFPGVKITKATSQKNPTTAGIRRNRG
jgi:hypothetical protein